MTDWCWVREFRGEKDWLRMMFLIHMSSKPLAYIVAEGQPQKTEHWVVGESR